MRARPQTSMSLNYVNWLPSANSVRWRTRWYAISWSKRLIHLASENGCCCKCNLTFEKPWLSPSTLKLLQRRLKRWLHHPTPQYKQFNNITGSNGATVKSTPRVDLQSLPVHVLATVADLSSTQLIFPDPLLRMQCAGTVTKQDILQRYDVETNGRVKLRYLMWLC